MNRSVGELRFQNASTAYGTWTKAGSETESWTLKAGGIFGPHVIIRESKAKDNLAVFRSNIRRVGWVEFSNKNKFHWKSTGFWRSEWGFSNVQDELVFVVRLGPWYLMHAESVVEIGTQWRDLDELPVLLMLGWYLSVQNFYAGW